MGHTAVGHVIIPLKRIGKLDTPTQFLKRSADLFVALEESPGVPGGQDEQLVHSISKKAIHDQPGVEHYEAHAHDTLSPAGVLSPVLFFPAIMLKPFLPIGQNESFVTLFPVPKLLRTVKQRSNGRTFFSI
jgi:hypothetical protein